MRCFNAKVQVDYLKTYQLPERLEGQQYLIDRAEEDLFCAVMLCRRKSGYAPLVNICYLLHQSVEKWLKVFLAVQGAPVEKGSKGHELYNLLSKAMKMEVQFEVLRSELNSVDPEILGARFPSSKLRYSETPTEIEDYIKALMMAAFKTRRLVKRYLAKEVR